MSNIKPPLAAKSVASTLLNALSDPFDVKLVNTAATLVDGAFHTNNAELAYTIPTGTTAHYEISLNGAIVYNSAIEPSTQTAEGAYTVIVTITDDVSGATRRYGLNFVLDKTPPAAPLIQLANDSGSSGSDLITSDSTLDDAAAEGVVTYYLVPNGGGEIVEMSLADINALLAARTGTGSVTVAAVLTDYAGNRSPESRLTFTIDRDPPAAPIVTVNTDQSFTVVPPADGVSILYSWRLAGTTNAFTTPTTTEPANLEAGTYDLQVIAVDSAGNRSTPAVDTFTASGEDILPAPTVELSKDSGASATDNYTNDETLTVTVEPGNVAQFSYDGGTTWLDAQNDNLPDGAHTILVRQIKVNATGEIIATSPTRALTVTLDTSAVPIELPDTVDLSTWLLTGTGGVTFTGQETGAVIEFSVDGNDWSATRPITGLDDGDQVWVRQLDLAGNTSTADIVTINVPPPVDPAPTPEARVQAQYNYEPSISGLF